MKFNEILFKRLLQLASDVEEKTCESSCSYLLQSGGESGDGKCLDCKKNMVISDNMKVARGMVFCVECSEKWKWFTVVLGGMNTRTAYLNVINTLQRVTNNDCD